MAVALSCAFPAPSAWAQGENGQEASGWYQFEAIVFLRPNTATFQKAHLTSDEAESPLGFQGIAAPAKHWRLSSDDRFREGSLPTQPLSRLQSAQERLQSRGFEVLWASAWKQPLQGAYPNLPLYIQAYEQAPGMPRLTGTLKLSVDRFIEAKVDLDYTQYVGTSPRYLTGARDTDQTSLSEGTITTAGDTAGQPHSTGLQSGAVPQATDPATPATPDGPGPVQAIAYEPQKELSFAPLQWQAQGSYRLQDQRRLREGELHYLDHSALGLLLIATPTSAAVQVTAPAEAAPVVSAP